MSKKKAKKLRRQHLANFEEWLDERSTEELAQVRVKYGISTPKFTAVLEVKKQPGSEESQHD